MHQISVKYSLNSIPEHLIFARGGAPEPPGKGMPVAHSTCCQLSLWPPTIVVPYYLSSSHTSVIHCFLPNNTDLSFTVANAFQP